MSPLRARRRWRPCAMHVPHFFIRPGADLAPPGDAGAVIALHGWEKPSCPGARGRRGPNERVMTWPWRWPRRTLGFVALSAGALAALLLLGLGIYSTIELRRFARAEALRSTFVYAAPQALLPGLHVRRVDLAGTLNRLKYVETRATPQTPGEFHRAANAWEIYRRGVDGGA